MHIAAHRPVCRGGFRSSVIAPASSGPLIPAGAGSGRPPATGSIADVSHPSPLTAAPAPGPRPARRRRAGRARRLLTDAVEAARPAYGEDHPDVLGSAHLLARLHREADDPAAARRVLEEAYAAGERRRGDADPLMLRAQLRPGRGGGGTGQPARGPPQLHPRRHRRARGARRPTIRPYARPAATSACPARRRRPNRPRSRADDVAARRAPAAPSLPPPPVPGAAAADRPPPAVPGSEWASRPPRSATGPATARPGTGTAPTGPRLVAVLATAGRRPGGETAAAEHAPGCRPWTRPRPARRPPGPGPVSPADGHPPHIAPAPAVPGPALAPPASGLPGPLPPSTYRTAAGGLGTTAPTGAGPPWAGATTPPPAHPPPGWTRPSPGPPSPPLLRADGRCSAAGHTAPAHRPRRCRTGPVDGAAAGPATRSASRRCRARRDSADAALGRSPVQVRQPGRCWPVSAAAAPAPGERDYRRHLRTTLTYPGGPGAGPAAGFQPPPAWPRSARHPSRRGG